MTSLLIVAALLIPILIGLGIMGSQSSVKIIHQGSSLEETCYTGFSWTYFLFGWLVPVLRGEAVIGLVHLLFTAFTLGLFQFVMAFLYNKQHAKRLLTAGYELSDSEPVNAHARAVFGLAGETDGSQDRWALAMTLSVIISVPAVIFSGVIGTAYDVGFFDSDSAEWNEAQRIEETVRQLERDAEEARRRAEELAKQSDEASLDSPELTRFENTYMEIERPLFANIVNSTKVLQVKVAIMTHYDDRVVANMEKHEFAIRSEMLDVMRKIDEASLSSPSFRLNLAEDLKIATNSTLERYEDFGGVEEVMFTEFNVQ